jgi:hypothetical protein
MTDETRQFDVIEKAAHYNQHPSGVECIEIKRHLSSDVGDAFKYVYRTEHKNGRQDLEKARYYLRDALRMIEGSARVSRLAVFLPSYSFRVQQLLDRVTAAETDPNRLNYFQALKRGDVSGMLEAVEAMLDTP